MAPARPRPIQQFKNAGKTQTHAQMSQLEPSVQTTGQPEGGDTTVVAVELKNVQPVFKQIRRRAYYRKE